MKLNSKHVLRLLFLSLSIFSVETRAELPEQFFKKVVGTETWTCKSDQNPSKVEVFNVDYKFLRFKNFINFVEIGFVKIEGDQLKNPFGKLVGTIKDDQIQIFEPTSRLRDQTDSKTYIFDFDQNKMTMSGHWNYIKYIDLEGNTSETKCTFTGDFKIVSIEPSTDFFATKTNHFIGNENEK